jgi:hypothetical protein
MMTMKAILAILCAVLLIYVPITEPASPAAPVLGQVMAKGDLKINGTRMPSGGTIFSGDEVGTGANTVAELIFNGSNKVLLPQSSAVILNSDAGQVIVQLKQGSLAMLSRSAAPVLIDTNGVRIKPAANTAVVMEVAALGNSFKVVMRKGSAEVETANKTLDVPEGKELDATAAPVPPTPAPSPQAPSGKSQLSTWSLIAAGAAGLTGLILGAVALSRPNASSCTAVSPSGNITCP